MKASYVCSIDRLNNNNNNNNSNDDDDDDDDDTLAIVAQSLPYCSYKSSNCLSSSSSHFKLFLLILALVPLEWYA